MNSTLPGKKIYSSKLVRIESLILITWMYKNIWLVNIIEMILYKIEDKKNHVAKKTINE